MKKLALNLEELAVTSFETLAEEARRGTVAAFDAAISGDRFTCKSCPTIVNTCCTPMA